MIHFAPWDRFFEFSSPSYGCFLKKKTQQTPRKVFPHHIVGAPSASNSHRSLNARAGQQHWLVCRKWDSHIQYPNFGSSHFLAIPIFGIFIHIDFSFTNDDNHCIGCDSIPRDQLTFVFVVALSPREDITSPVTLIFLSALFVRLGLPCFCGIFV